MKLTRARTISFFLFVAALLCCERSWAQSSLEPAQLPSRTVFYAIWRGTPSGEARRANPLIALWDDPDLAPFRAALLQNMQSGDRKGGSKPALSAREVDEMSSLLENSLLVGYVRKPEVKVAAVSTKVSERSWNGFFLVYDRSGKEALLAKTILRLQSQEKEPPRISQITAAGAPALKIERKDSVTYWADHGKYAVSSGELSVVEELLSRIDGKAVGPSLGQVAAYQEAHPSFSGGVLEFFLRVPQLKDLAPDAAAPNMPVKIGPVLDALRLESIHSISGHLTLEGSKARLQGAMLGDVAPGTPFDLWTASEKNPPSLAFLTPDTISYSDTQFNFSAFYDLLKRALHVALPQSQQGAAEMLEGFAATRIGMPLPDALALLNGEFGSLQSNPAMDPQKAVFFVGIRKKQEVLKLLRTIFSDQLGPERNEGDTTLLKVSLGGGQNSTGIAQWNFYHLAVTPNFVLASSRSENLRTVLASRTAGSAGLPPRLQAARSQFPESINGITFASIEKMDWPTIKARWIEESRKAAEKSRKASASSRQELSDQVPEWLEKLNPEVFPRHLHFVAGVSWKDAKGVHADEWIE